MKFMFALCALFATVNYASAQQHASMPTIKEAEAECRAMGMASDRGFCIPSLELSKRLAKVISLTHCTPISGMSCRLTLLVPGMMPSKIFYQGLDKNGNPVGHEHRLIYPDLEKNGWHSGIATFLSSEGNAVRFRLRGVWPSKESKNN